MVDSDWCFGCFHVFEKRQCDIGICIYIYIYKYVCKDKKTMHLALQYPHQTWTCRLKHIAVHHVTSLERLGVTMRMWGNSMNFRERMTMCSILLPEDLEIKIVVNASCP